MDPAQAMLADNELTGVVTDDDRVGRKAMRLHAAPKAPSMVIGSGLTLREAMGRAAEVVAATSFNSFSSKLFRFGV
jgi:hypothetical protein